MPGMREALVILGREAHYHATREPETDTFRTSIEVATSMIEVYRGSHTQCGKASTYQYGSVAPQMIFPEIWNDMSLRKFLQQGLKILVRGRS